MSTHIFCGEFTILWARASLSLRFTDTNVGYAEPVPLKYGITGYYDLGQLQHGCEDTNPSCYGLISVFELSSVPCIDCIPF